jgi:hypothetical protein
MQVDRTPIAKSPDVTDGVHELVLVQTEVAPSKFDPAQESRYWHFKPVGQTEKDEEFVYFSGTSRGDKLAALMDGFGVETDENGVTDVDEEALVGQTVKAFIQKKPGKRDPSKKFSRIVSILPAA